MASGQTKLTICNAALDMLHEAALTSLADDRPVARWFAREYERIRDSLLAAHTWNFASRRVAIAADGVPPGFGWTNSFTLPTDFIRVHYVNRGGYHNGQPVTYEIEGGKIVTNEAAPLYLRYIRKVTTEGDFDILFCTALAASLAEELSHWITGKTSFTQLASAKRQDAVKQARLLDSIQGTAESVNDDDVINVRYVRG